MKRKIAWLALPLVLAASASDAGERIKQPKPTKLDLEVRALMSKHLIVKVTRNRRFYQEELGTLSGAELKPFVDSLYLSAKSNPLSHSTSWKRASQGYLFLVVPFKVRRNELPSADMRIDIANKEGVVFMARADKLLDRKESIYDLHPFTIKHWMDILLANPRVAPKLRIRFKR